METKTSRKVTSMILAGACAAALAVGAAAPAFAAPVSGETNVSYNRVTVVPGTTTWGVQIPSGIVFTNNQTEGQKADVKLVKIEQDGSYGDGASIPNADLPGGGTPDQGKVEVSVASKTGMQLTVGGTDAGTDPVPYQLVYSGTGAVSNATLNPGTGKTVTPIASLTQDKTTATGWAHRLGTAAVDGAHTDILTYSYNNGV